MELQGKVIFISEPRSGVSKSTGNPWMMQDYVIETHEQYPKRMMFNVFGEDKIKLFNIQMGEEINVFFDINAREYNGKYYNDIRAWRVDRVDPNNPMPQQPAAPAYPQQPGMQQPFPPQQPAAPAYPQQQAMQQPFPPQQQAAPAYPQQPQAGAPATAPATDFSQQGDDENLPF